MPQLARTSSTSRRTAATIVVLIADNNASKLACKMAKAFLHKEVDTLHLVTCIMNEDGRISANYRLAQFIDPELAHCTVTNVVVKDDEHNIYEAISMFVASLQPDLILLGSQSLCMPPQDSGRPMAPPATRSRVLSDGTSPVSASALVAGYGSFALRLVAEMRSAPVLVVKINSKGAFLQSTYPVALKCMVDLQANSRHVLEWLFERINPDKDQLSLTVSQAYDGKNQVKHEAQRLLTAFSVQAAVNSFPANKHLYKDAATKALPQAVSSEEVDILVVQAPRCKGLSPTLTELLFSARTSLLVWPADRASGSGQ